MVKATIRKRDGEYIVTVWVNGQVWGTYFTDDKQDAVDTCSDMCIRAQASL